MEQLLTDIDQFLTDTGMSVTAFGVEATGDKNLIPDLRNGRDIRSSTERRIRVFMATQSRIAA